MPEKRHAPCEEQDAEATSAERNDSRLKKGALDAAFSARPA